VETVEFFIRYVVLMMEQSRRSVQPKEADIKDALSGLYTAKFMADRLEEELRNGRRDQKPCGLVLVKLKKFRDVLHKNGILSIEASLKKIARIIEDNLEAGEKAARCGEDAFGIIMPRVNKSKLELAARELLGKIQSDLCEDARELDVAVSFAENPIDGITVDELLAHATIALQQTTERHAS
jgi:diguanylate cyclase (GGDEF)-like protein